MKIKLRDYNGRITQEVEVDEDFGTLYLAMEAKEHTEDRKYRYHCPTSLESMDYEGEWFASKGETPAEYTERIEFEERLPGFMATLTETQRRRLVLLGEGLTERQVAEREKVSLASVQETRRQLKAKYVSFFGYDPEKGSR